MFWGCTENFVDNKVFQNSHLPKLTKRTPMQHISFNLIIKYWMLIARRISYGCSHKRPSLNINFVRGNIYYTYKLSGGKGQREEKYLREGYFS